MAKFTVHLQPAAGFSACGLGHPLTSDSTTDVNKVTCRKCFQTVAGRNRSRATPAALPGAKPQGDRPKIHTSFRCEPEIYERLQQERDRTAVINQALKSYYADK